MDPLDGKVAIVTGGGSGIGEAVSRELARRGARVIIADIDDDAAKRVAAAIADGGGQATASHVDVSQEQDITRLVQDTAAAYGRLDFQFNNAGIAIRGGPPSETDLDAMREVYETNVFGVVLVTNAMLPLLRRAPAARIVNVSSEVGSITSMTDPASPLAQMPAGLAYPSSKSALNMITAMYAKELRDTPIKVNAANPGYTATDLNRHSGFRSVAEGAEASVHLATLPEDGPSGILWGHLWTEGGYGPLPW